MNDTNSSDVPVTGCDDIIAKHNISCEETECTHGDQGATLVVASFSTDISLDKLCGQQKGSSEGMSFSACSSLASQHQLDSADDELEYLLGTSDSSVPKNEPRTVSSESVCSDKKMSDDSSLHVVDSEETLHSARTSEGYNLDAPEAEYELQTKMSEGSNLNVLDSQDVLHSNMSETSNLKEIDSTDAQQEGGSTEVEATSDENVLQSPIRDQCVLPDNSELLNLSPIHQCPSLFPTSDDYTYFSPEDVDYCNDIFGINNAYLSKELEQGNDNTKTNEALNSVSLQEGQDDLIATSEQAASGANSFLNSLTNLSNNEAYSYELGQTLANKSNDFASNDFSITAESSLKNTSTASVAAAAAAAASLNPPNAKSEYAIVTPGSTWLQQDGDQPVTTNLCPPLPPLTAFASTEVLPQVEYKIQGGTQESGTTYPDQEKPRGTSRSDIAWNQRFMELQQFKKIHGHCNVPQKYEKNPSLGAWVARNRLFMRQFEDGKGQDKTSVVQCERMRLLKQIGLASNIGKGAFGRTTGHLMSSRNAREWENQFNALKGYCQLHGNCDVPVKSENYRSLGRWVSAQRKKYHQYFDGGTTTGKPSNDLVARFERLKEIGFNFCIGSGKAKRASKSS